MALGIHPELLAMTYEALQAAAPRLPPNPGLISCSPHTSSTGLPLVPPHSEPVCWLFLLPETLFPQLCLWFPAGSHVLREALADYPKEIPRHHTLFLPCMAEIILFTYLLSLCTVILSLSSP